MHKHNINTYKSQEGLVSILVTMVIMMILSLIVLGFAQTTRREQRQSLDRQLLAQASYAAETGINDVEKYIRDRQALGLTINKFDKCDPTSAGNFIASRPLGSNSVDGTTTTYSCVLINPSPPELIWQRVNADASIAFPFNPTGSNSQITIMWQDGGSVPTSYGSCGTSVPLTGAFRPLAGGAPNWTCEAGALRVDITPIGRGLLTRRDLLDDTRNLVLYPLDVTGGTLNQAFPPLDHGNIIPVKCNPSATPRHCQITLTGANAAKYYIRIRPMYRSANIYVSGNADGLADAQAIVDVTGKANDILKRLQVRLPINALESENNSTIDYALQSIDTICKRASIVPGGSPPVVNTGPPGEPSCP